MNLPNFLHIGAGKCASGWLWKVCKEHPQIYSPETPDNVNFFTNGYHRGLPWYSQTYFSDISDAVAVGEFSNSYSAYEPALLRIARDLPEVRLTFTIRNPVERAYLHWAHMHLKTKYKLNPAEGIGIPLEKVLHHHGHNWWRSFIEPGLYGFLIERLYRIFPKERVLIMVHDDLVSDPQGFLQRFFDFLGVDDSFQSSLVGVDVNSDRRTAAEGMNPEFRVQLREALDEDLRRASELVGRDLTHWK